MESLKEKKSERIKNKMKKVILLSTFATAITIGTGASYASSPTIQDSIQKLVGTIVNPLMPEIHKELSTTSDQYSKDIIQRVEEVANIIPKAIEDYKAAEVKRGKEELEKYRNNKLIEINDAKDAEIAAGKQKLKDSTDKDIEEGKNKIDAALKSQAAPSTTEESTENK